MEKETSIWNFINREKNQLRNNCIKYYIISRVLDYLVICKFNKNKKSIKYIPLDDVKSWLYSQYTFDYAWKVPSVRIQLLIQEMSFLDLIKFDETREYITLTETGYNAYKSQQYHFAYASLLEAKNSRMLSKTAIGISIIAIIIAIL